MTKSEPVEANPMAISRINISHIRILERRRNYLLAKAAKEYRGDSYDKAECAALEAALAELKELHQQRQEHND